jgi:hypothetical protein
MNANQKPLWTWPKCGHQLVTRNLWHSCGQYDLESHFNDRSVSVKEAFNHLVQVANDCGPVTIYAQKTRIVFMDRVRFASVITRKRWLNISLWLTRRINHPRLHRVEKYGLHSFGHQFKLSNPKGVDTQLETLICEAYRVGRQEHLRSS